MRKFIYVLALVAVANAHGLRRIVGGSNATEGQFPYQVSLGYFDGATYENYQHRCGGSIISDRWIITAAHCTPESFTSWKVVAGIIDLQDIPNAQIFNIEKMIPYYGVNYMTGQNDIQLMMVDREISFNDKITPIQLGREYISGGKQLITTGWGYTNCPDGPKCTEGQLSQNLQFLEVRSLSNSECQSQLEGENILPIYDTDLCALPMSSSSVCYGDSGGPMALGNEIVGIVSRTVGCSSPTTTILYPDIYTRVSEYIDWIESHIL